jgi:hypothetical protein
MVAYATIAYTGLLYIITTLPYADERLKKILECNNIPQLQLQLQP